MGNEWGIGAEKTKVIKFELIFPHTFEFELNFAVKECLEDLASGLSKQKPRFL